MKWDDINEQTCSISRSLSILGDRWTLLVIRQIFMRMRRFSEIQSSLGITRHRLSDRLNRLIEQGILYREAYDKRGTRFEYKLTEKGLDLFPILLALARWGDTWMADSDGTPILYVHRGCGEAAQPTLSCTQCGKALNARNTYAIPGPGILNKVERDEFSKSDTQLYQRSFDSLSNASANQKQ